MLSLQQKLAQQLKLIPQQIQYQKLLQLNNLSLELRIQNELNQNPLLEEIPKDDVDTEINQPELDAGIDDVQKEESEDRILDEYSFDDYQNDDLEGYKSNYSQSDENYDIPAPNLKSLREYLMEQLLACELSDELHKLGEEIIGNTGDDGYLKLELEYIVKDLELFENIHIDFTEAEKLLKKIQHFDPIGIASRTLQECLLIQAKAKENNSRSKEIAIRILESAFDIFLAKRYEQIELKLEITREELKNALEFIQHLDPKPGEGNLISTNINQVTPDLIVEKINEKFHIYLNEKFVSRVRMNDDYYALYKKGSRRSRTEQEKQMRQFLKENIDNAKWFIDAISQRKLTLLKIMAAIVDKQFDFFESGEKFLKPMVLKDIAEMTNLDISTCSRVVKGKYVQSSVGIHELKYFFSEGLETESGIEVSNKNVKVKIQELIAKEDKNNPLTDDLICDILKKEGIKIARRTVAKYRDMLNIPVAKMRREL